MLPYEAKDQKRLVELVASSSQGFLVSDFLVSALTKKLTKVDEYHRIWMVECDCSPGTKIGTIIIQKISQEHNSSELIVTFDDGEICNDPKVFKKVLNMLLEYVFADLGLLRLQVEVIENNLKLRQAYKRVGFVEEGLLRSKYEIKGRRHDAYVMSILKIEWARLRN